MLSGCPRSCTVGLAHLMRQARGQDPPKIIERHIGCRCGVAVESKQGSGTRGRDRGDCRQRETRRPRIGEFSASRGERFDLTRSRPRATRNNRVREEGHPPREYSCFAPPTFPPPTSPVRMVLLGATSFPSRPPRPTRTPLLSVLVTPMRCPATLASRHGDGGRRNSPRSGAARRRPGSKTPRERESSGP